MSETESPYRLAFKLGVSGRCPRCQSGHIFSGWLKMSPKCEVCGLDFSFADPADGPAFFAQLVGAIPAVILALWLQMKFSVPLWVHLFTTLPLLLLPTLLLLRPIKGWLVCSQYLHRADGGRELTRIDK